MKIILGGPELISPLRGTGLFLEKICVCGRNMGFSLVGFEDEVVTWLVPG